MPLSVGNRLGPYEILAPIGAGGMGEVYRARDTKLDRDVAIKVLPAALAQDPERLARFEREAKVLAALNHPNIAQIYGLEQRALVMELVEGETLKGPQPLETALNYVRQIADALEAAHEKGITHRDLKPANIMITPAGVVKVLDFGLAAVTQDPASGGTDPSNSPTLTMRATQTGMIMGTAAYMSPEQAAGKTVDKRADIWSFGVVLFELLTGRQLFGEGETISHTLADVLRAPIDFDKLPKETPKSIRELLRRCLDRDVKNRLRDIGEARVVLGSPRGGTEEPSKAEARPTAKPAWTLAAVFALAAVGAGLVAWRATRPVEQPLIRLSVDLGPDTLTSIGVTAAISPDGRRLVFSVRSAAGSRLLATRLLDQPTATLLPGTEGGRDPFFSPDGQWIGFFAGGKLKKISVLGGASLALCDATNGRGGSWGEDGNIVAALSPAAGTGLSRVSAAGGPPQALTKPLQGERDHRWPKVLPGGNGVLFSAFLGGNADEASIEVLSLKTGQTKPRNFSWFEREFFGSPGRTRTYNPWVTASVRFC
jgi:predicted Ser/Thr protein kinase